MASHDRYSGFSSTPMRAPVDYRLAAAFHVFGVCCLLYAAFWITTPAHFQATVTWIHHFLVSLPYYYG